MSELRLNYLKFIWAPVSDHALCVTGCYVELCNIIQDQ